MDPIILSSWEETYKAVQLDRAPSYVSSSYLDLFLGFIEAS